MPTTIRTLILAALASGCTVVELDAEVQSACTTRHDLAIEPAPPGVAGGEAVTIGFELALAALDELAALDTDLRLAHVRLTPTAGVEDLAFVGGALVTLASADPDATLPTITVVDCQGDCGRDGGELLLDAAGDADPMDYVRAGAIALDLTLRGRPPTIAWALDVEVCATGRATTSARL